MRRYVGIGALVMVLAVLGAAMAADKEPRAQRWEKVIQRFEKQDKADPPPQGGILFVGSSSIRMWDLDKWFPDKPVINRGFGGSCIEDVLYYFERVVLPYAPKIIVFYSGDNDVDYGMTIEKVTADYQTFANRVHAALPETRIAVISIKPSLARWKLWEKMREVNRRIRVFAEETPWLVYIDGATPMLGEDGKPRPELLLKDGLHMTGAGYAIWSQRVRPHLEDPSPNETTGAKSKSLPLD